MSNFTDFTGGSGGVEKNSQFYDQHFKGLTRDFTLLQGSANQNQASNIAEFPSVNRLFEYPSSNVHSTAIDVINTSTGAVAFTMDMPTRKTSYDGTYTWLLMDDYYYDSVNERVYWFWYTNSISTVPPATNIIFEYWELSTGTRSNTDRDWETRTSRHVR